MSVSSEPPDLIYLLGPGEHNEQLRHSLRSLQNLPHRRVWIAGYQPRWVRGVGRIPVRQKPGQKWRNQEANLRAACAHPDVAESCVLFNDDFFVLQPIERVPVLHRGPLVKILPGYSNSYTARLRATSGHLGPDALAYDWIHTPLPFTKSQMAVTLDTLPDGLLMRTVYGNQWRIGGSLAKDAKINQSDAVPEEGRVFLSTSDHSFRSRPVGKWIRERFPEPGPYER